MFIEKLPRGAATMVIALLAVLSGGVTSPARADTFTWGNTNTDWSTASDWLNNAVPGPNDVALFNLNSTYSKLPSLSISTSAGAIWDTGSGSVTISSNTLTLSGTTINSGTDMTGIELDSGAGSMTISSALVLGGSQTWLDNSTKPFKITGPININGFALTIQGTGASTYSGVISGAGTLSVNGPGALTLNYKNTFGQVGSSVAGTVVVNGTLVTTATATNYADGVVGFANIIVNSGALVLMGTQDAFVGTNFLTTGARAITIQINQGGMIADNVGTNNQLASLILDGGTLAATKADGDHTSIGNWDLTSVSTLGDGKTSYISGGTVTLGTMPMNSNVPVVFSVGMGDTLIVSSTIANANNAPRNEPLTLTGSGTLILTASETYTTATTISGGTLQFGTGTAGQDGFDSRSNITDNAVLNYDLAGSLTYQGQITGSGSVVKSGSGNLAITVQNTYSGGTIINGGMLTLATGTKTPPLGTGLVTINGGTLNLNGLSTLTAPGLSGSGGMVLAGTSGATLTLAPTAAANYAGTIGGLTSVVLNSTTAVQTFSGANTTTGQISVTAGTLALGLGGTLGGGNNLINPGSVLDTWAYNGSGGYNLASGTLTAGRTDLSALIDINGSMKLAPNGTLSPAGASTAGTLTVNGGFGLSGGSIAYDPGDLIALNGTLNLAAASYIVPTAPVTNGTYTLFTATSVTGSVSYLHKAGFFAQSPRQTYVFDDSTGTAVTLTVSGGPGILTWTAAVNNTWDDNTNLTGTPNWYNTTTQVADYFYTNDLVTFDDSAGSAAGNVMISSSGVFPGSVTVNNMAVSYTFSGGGIGGAGFLTMNGPGALTIDTSNTYTGGTTLAGGLLNLGNSAALGLGRFTISGGSLDNTSGAPMTLSGNIAQTLSGGFTFVGSNPLNTGTGAVTAAAPSDIIVANNTLTIGGPISGNGVPITKDGPGTLVLGASSSFNGGVTLNAGVLNFANHALGTGNIVLNGGTLQYASGASTDVSVNGITLNGTATVDTNGSNVTWQGGTPVSGGGSLVKIGSGNLSLTIPESYTGATTVNAGTLVLAGQNRLNNNGTTEVGTLTGPLTINPGATVVATQLEALGIGASNWLRVININAGTLLTNATGYANGWGTQITMSAGTLSSGNNSYFSMGDNPTFTVTGTNSSSLISGVLNIGDSTNTTFTLTRGSAPADLIDTGGIGYADPDPLDFQTNSPPGIPSTGWATGGIVLNGNGIMILAAGNSYAGNTVINGGTLQVGMGGAAATLPTNGQLSLGSDGPTVLGPSYSSSITDNATLAFSSTASLVQGIHFSALPISGSGDLIQLGPGNLTLNVANTYSGGTIVNGGTLTVGNSLALGQGPLAVNGGVFNLNGFGITLPGLAGSGGTVTSILPAVLTLAPTAATNYSGNITGAVAVTVNSSGAVQILSGANSYTGQTTIVSGGTLALGSGGSLGVGTTLINPGGVLDTTAYSGGGYNFTSGVLVAGRTASLATDVNGTLNVAGAAVSTAGAGTVGTLMVNGGFGLSGGTIAYDAGDQIAVQGGLSLSGSDFVVPNSPLPSGVYTLFTEGSLTGSTSSLGVTGLYGNSARQTYTFAASGTTAVTLTVTGTVGNLVWTGGTNGTWDNQMSLSWFNASSGSADVFYAGDLVTFDDTAGTANNVTINDNVQPATLIISNTAINLTFSGTGSIIGVATLVKNGPGGLTINTSNAYAGGTLLNGGVLNANAAQALGSGAVNINGGTLNANAPQSIASVALASGQLNFGNSAALGNSPLAIYGGALDNTSGSAMTLAGTGGQSWNGSFTFLGSNPLNLGAGPIALGANAQVTVANSNLTVGGVISGSNSLTVNGPGTLTLAASNVYTGGTVLNSGVLSLAATGAIGSGTLAASGGTLQFAAGNTQDISSRLLMPSGTASIDTQGNIVTFASAIGGSGSGSLIKVGSGRLALSAANTFTGNTTINGGTLQLNVQGNGGSPGALMSPTVTVNQGAVLALNVVDALAYIPGVAALTINGGTVSNITASSRVTIENPLTMTGGLLTGSGSGDSNGVYSFNTPISFNAINATSDAGGNPAIISVRAIALSTAGSVTFNVTRGPANPAADLVINAAINEYSGFSGNGINQTGNGILLLTASNNYNGVTTINGGTLQLGTGQIGQDGSIGSTSGVIDNTVLVYNLFGSQTAAYPINGNGGLTKLGPGLLRLSGANSFYGGTSVNTGTLQLGNSAALGNGGLAANGGTLDLAGYNAAVMSFSGAAGVIVNSNSASVATLTTSQYFPTTFSGSLRNGAGKTALSMNGYGGNLTLAGTNTYSGPTTVSGGVLTAGALNSLSPNSPVTVSGGVLDVTAAPQTISSLAVGAMGSLNLYIGNVLTSSGSAGFASGSTLSISGSIASLPELLMTYSGLPGGSFTNVTYNGSSLPGTDELFYSSGSLEIVNGGPAYWIAGSGNWSVGTNWSSGNQPNGAGLAAVLSQSGGAVAVNLDVPVTLGSLALGNTGGAPAGYALSGNTLTFNNNGGTASVTVFGGAHSINSAVSLQGGSLEIAASNSAILTIAGNLSDDGGQRSLTLDGDGSGQLILSGSNTYGGGTIVDSGTLIANSASALPGGSSLTVGQDASQVFAPAIAGPSIVGAPAGVAAVPEPETIVLLAFGTALLALYRKLVKGR